VSRSTPGYVGLPYKGFSSGPATGLWEISSGSVLTLKRPGYSLERPGRPQSVLARTVRNPHTANLAATKTIAILDYGNSKRVFVATNHNHDFGPERQHSYVQWEGLRDAARITMGVNLDDPTGKPDTAEYAERGSNSPRWHSLPVSGNNFPDAFMGTMGALQSFAEGSASTLPSHFEDAFQTMALVEALYRSSELPGLPLPLDE